MATVGVKHSKVVTIPDDPNYPVGSDEWNDFHVVTGLENVDNTSDVNKPVSTAQAAADAAVAATAATATALKANIASPTFTGTPAAPTASANNNSTQLATTAYVDGADATRDAAIALKAATTYVDAADAVRDTAIALKAPLASPALTGTPTAPTAAGGTNTTQLATTAFVAAALTGSGVSSLNGQTGALKVSAAPNGRLTLQTLTPVMTTTQSGKTTIFYTPYNGNQVPIYDGTNMVPTTFSELSVLTTDTTKSPAAIGASKVNDWFVWNDAGTVRIGHGPDWTSDSARSAGTALVMVNGILLNNAAITNGPAASRGTYVGTTRSNASSQLDWIFGGLAVGGTAGFFGVWNAYNRVNVASFVGDTTDTWTYSTATWRNADGSATYRASFVSGLAEDAFEGMYSCTITAAAAAASYGTIGVGFGSTTPVGHQAFNFSGASGGNAQTSLMAMGRSTVLGFSYVQALEHATSVSATTFAGDQGAPGTTQSGLTFGGRM